MLHRKPQIKMEHSLSRILLIVKDGFKDVSPSLKSNPKPHCFFTQPLKFELQGVLNTAHPVLICTILGV